MNPKKIKINFLPVPIMFGWRTVATAVGLAGRGSLSPTSSVADLRANRDAAVDKFSVSISSFLLDVKMGSDGKDRGRMHLDEDSPVGYLLK